LTGLVVLGDSHRVIEELVTIVFYIISQLYLTGRVTTEMIRLYSVIYLNTSAIPHCLL